MKVAILLLALVSVALAEHCYQRCSSSSECPSFALSCERGCCSSHAADQDEMSDFFQFTQKFNRVYANRLETEKRFDIFRANLKLIDYLNKIDSATYAVNEYADLSPAEFKALMHPTAMKFNFKSERAEPKVRNDLPTSWDWREKGAVTPVKNQGQCGSCWAFSTICNVEGILFLSTQNLVSYSEQELVDCDKLCDPDKPQLCCAGCNGGEMYLGLEYIITNGVTTEAKYPYTARDDQCKYDPSQADAHISAWEPVSKDEDVIAQYCVDNGPLSIGINAEWMQFYFGGISDPLWCSPEHLDHGVAIVGFGEEKGKKYWIIKNSWGEGWGEKGYYRIIRGKGKCGVNEQVASGKV